MGRVSKTVFNGQLAHLSTGRAGVPARPSQANMDYQPGLLGKKVQSAKYRSYRKRLSWQTTLLALCVVLGGVNLAYSLPWNTDMYGQPNLKAGTAPQAPPEHTIPTTGAEPPMSSRMSVRIKAGLTLKNPIPVSEESLATGKALFNIYCTPCHGPHGKGDGRVVGKGIPSSDLHADRIKRQKDGYMYATIRSGGIIMPSYNHALSTKERWAIVNYVRHLQGQ